MDFLPEEFDEILNIFSEETEEIIQKLNNNLLRLEEKPNDKELLVFLFRDAHSLKGASRMIGFNNIQRLAHKIEDVLGYAKEGKIVINSSISDVLYKSIDFLSELIQKSVKSKKEYYTDEIQVHIDNIENTISNSLKNTPEEILPDEAVENSHVDKFDKNHLKINALLVEAFLMITKIEADEDSKYLETFFDIIQQLYTLFGTEEFITLKEFIENLDLKCKFVRENSGILTKDEIEEINEQLVNIEVSINEIYKKKSFPQVDFHAIVKNKLAEKNNAQIEENSENDSVQFIIDETISDIKSDFSNMENNLSQIPHLIDNLNYLISLKLNDDANTVFDKIIQVLTIIKKNNNLPEKEVITILKQSICSTEKMIVSKNKDDYEDAKLVIQRLDIIQQILDLSASVNPLSQLTENLKESGVSVKKAQDFFNSFETTSIKTLRVDTKKLDKLVNQTGELIVSRIKHKKHLSELENLVEELSDWKNFNTKSQSFIKYYDKKLANAIQLGDYESIAMFGKQVYAIFQKNSSRIAKLNGQLLNLQKSIDEDDTKFNIIVKELEDMVKNIRVLPLATIFHMFPRMIRDISKVTGKQIELLISGSETSADKKVIEEIKTPLMHIIRNSIDHGIEPPQERIATGKSPVGKIHLHAKSLENKIIIEVNDDGRGIDIEKIKNRALEKKLITEKECMYLTDEQIMNIIFWSGFSTENTVTEISGRGMGLDIVQTKISQLNGKVKIYSVIGHGTKISIELPITMSTLKAFIVEASGQLFALPMSSVKNVTWIKKDDIYKRNNVKSIMTNGRSTQIYYLSELLELPKNEALNPDKLTLVVIEAENSSMGLIVDSILGDQEILQKKLSPPIIILKNISGITTLVTGKVCLILNLPELYKNTYINFDSSIDKSHNQLLTKNNEDYNLLVVDDSKTTRSLLKTILSSKGYKFEMVDNPKDALNILSKKKFDLILSDFEMPEMNGIAFVKEIKSNEKLKNIPIIILSSHNPGKFSILSSGANAFITKSEFNQNYLLETIKSVLK